MTYVGNIFSSSLNSNRKLKYFPVEVITSDGESYLSEVEARNERKSIIITSLYPHTSGYDMVGDQTVADAILDRIIHSARLVKTNLSAKFISYFNI
ncbi:MAG: ATP-binding protein [Muribaculaceae bacterium]|nr:ATP-binding protein [Muribaculaceae bacterium]